MEHSGRLEWKSSRSGNVEKIGSEPCHGKSSR